MCDPGINKQSINKYTCQSGYISLHFWHLPSDKEPYCRDISFSLLTFKNSSEVIEKLRLRNFQGSQVSSFDFLLYTHPCHLISSKQKCCLLLNCVSTESQKLTSVHQLRRDFSPTRNMTRMHVGLALSYVKLLLSSWKMYMCNLMAWFTNK